MTKKPLFWIILSFISLVSAFFAIRYFPKAFPIVNLELTMNRGSALETARQLAKKHGLGPAGFKQAADFNLDSHVRDYVELEVGGTEAFARMLKENLYSPYTWQVRHFKEGETLETYFSFTPQGAPYEFSVKLPEKEAGADIPADRALAIARQTAEHEWNIDFSPYELAEQSQELKAGGRRDHTFVFERPNVKIGEGRYRMRLVVSGDKLTEVSHFIKIPETFDRNFQRMRSANETLSSAATIAVGVLYVAGGCIGGILFLLRKRLLLWKTPIIVGFSIAFLQVLSKINGWPLEWMGYDTAISYQGYILKHIVGLFYSLIYDGLLLSVSFMAAEGLTRKAFPKQIQLWKLWSSDGASSTAVLGRTAAGFLLVSIFYLYQVGLYFVTRKGLGWWIPSDTLFDPNILATYLPWFDSFAQAAHAGMWEESLFRAVPLASAALLGKRFGKPMLWIAGAMILQTALFGAAHANYPNQPYYARLVEIIIPALGFGFLYLIFGLLPGIILHFGFDIVGMSVPLIVSTAHGVWFDKTILVVIMLIPVWVLLIARAKKGSWQKLPEYLLNGAWQKETSAVTGTGAEMQEHPVLYRPVTNRVLLIAGIIGLGVWIASTRFKSDVSALTVNRSHAVASAQKVLGNNNVHLTAPWRILSIIEGTPSDRDRFIWQKGGKKLYESLLSKGYLWPPRWLVRFARFQGNVTERAEEYLLLITDGGNLFRFHHNVPEEIPGETLTEAQARLLAFKAIAASDGIDPSTLKEISAQSFKLPKRTDWEFEFSNPPVYPLSEGQARIVVKIAGNSVNDTFRYIYVPETWTRQEQNRENTLSIIHSFCSLVLITFFVAGVIAAIIAWSRSRMSVAIFIAFFVILACLRIFSLVNNWPATAFSFSTAEPLRNQVSTKIGYALLATAFVAFAGALVNGFLFRQQRSLRRDTTPDAIQGISAGVLFASLLSLGRALIPKSSPLWPQFTAASSYLPLLQIILTTLLALVSITTLLLLFLTAIDGLTDGGRKRSILSLLLFILLGFVLAGNTAFDSLSAWIAGGIIIGVLLSIFYRFLFRFRLSLVPLTAGALLVLTTLQQAAFHVYPQAVTGSLLAVFFTAASAYLWFILLDIKNY